MFMLRQHEVVSPKLLVITTFCDMLVQTGRRRALPAEQPALERMLSMESPSAITAIWRSFDAQYMQPIFGGPGPDSSSVANRISCQTDQH